MRWNRDTFLNNIDTLIRDCCQDNADAFNKLIGSPNAVENWVNGKSPTIKEVVRTCEAFGCPFLWLVQDKAHPGRTSHAVVYASLFQGGTAY